MKLLQIINNKFDQFLAGLSVAVIGIFLLVDRQYFFYPPEWSSLMNDMKLDVIILVAGIGLVICGLYNNKIRWLSAIFFILAGAAVLALASIQLMHVVYAGQFRMAHTIIGDVIIFILIIHAAYNS